MSILLFVESFTMVFTITFIFGLLAKTNNLVISLANSNKGNLNVCTSEQCMAMSENLLRKMDRSAHPCLDFYTYSCGKYNEIDAKNEIDKSLLRATAHVTEIAKQPLKEDDHRALKMTKEMFKFCMKHESNIEDLKKKISYLGGWSLLDPNWKEKDFSIVKFYSKSMEIGYLSKSLFEIDIEMNTENRQNIIAIKQRIEPAAGLIKRTNRPLWYLDMAVNEDDFEDYFKTKFIPRLADKMNISRKKLERELWEFDRTAARINIQHNLQNLGGNPQLLEVAYRMPIEPKLMKLGEVNATWSNIPWIQIFDAVFNPLNTTVSMNDTIYIECSECLNSLNDLIRNISIKSLATYFMGYFLYDTIMDADDDILTQWIQLQDGRGKEEYCANKIFSPFSRVVDYEYYKHYYDKNSISMVRDFSENLKNAMVGIISVSKMVDNEDRDKTIDKVKKMVFKIGYDDEISSEQKRSLSYFDKLNINPNVKSYLPSLFNVMKFIIEKRLRSIGRPSKLPYLSATLANAVYHAYHNTVSNLLVGVLYSKGNRHQYLNFGGLGTAIAHEMNHAFDLTGKLFDNYGAFRESWWNPTTSARYWEKIECIENQYSNFTNVATGHQVNGRQTVRENFCDIGGAEVAYKAYRDFPKDGELLLPNFDRSTLLKMFWIGLATTWCANPSMTTVLQRERTDEHAIERIRVNGALMNSKEFAIDWGCKDYLPMNPPQKCTIWK